MVTPSKGNELNPSGYWRVSSAHRTTVATKQLQVGSSRVEAKTGQSGLNPRRLLLSAWVQGDLSQGTIYIGDSGVTVSDGFPLYPRDQLVLAVDGSVGVYAVADVGEGESSRLTIMELE